MTTDRGRTWTYIEQQLEGNSGLLDPDFPMFCRNIMQYVQNKLNGDKSEKGERRKGVGGKLRRQEASIEGVK